MPTPVRSAPVHHAGERTVERPHTIRATYLLILINIVVFAILNVFPDTRTALLPDPQHVMQAPWTIVSGSFSHELLFHLALNMGLVFLFGRELERAVGGGYVVLVYVLTGVLGVLTIIPYASVIEWTGPVAGASAAAFGIVAAVAAIRPDLTILKGKAMQWMLALFVTNVVITVLNPDVSIGGPAHAVGLISGYLLGSWMKHRARRFDLVA